MEYQVENSVRLSNQSPHANLYSWFLEEFDASGKKLGPDYVPWDWGLNFEVRNFRVLKGLTIGDEKQNLGSDVIRADLFPDLSDSRSARSYSFFGTNRQVENFTLRILKSDDNSESCNVFGTISYESEWDFQMNKSGDVVDLTIMLPAAKYDDLAKFVDDGRSTGRVTLQGVQGFYSAWSPSIRTTHLKILSNVENQKVQFEDGSTVKPPLTGRMAAFNVEFAKGDLSEEKTLPSHSEGERLDVERPTDPQPADALKASFAALERKISRLAVPVWFAVGALVVSLLFRH